VARSSTTTTNWARLKHGRGLNRVHVVSAGTATNAASIATDAAPTRVAATQQLLLVVALLPSPALVVTMPRSAVPSAKTHNVTDQSKASSTANSARRRRIPTLSSSPSTATAAT